MKNYKQQKFNGCHNCQHSKVRIYWQDIPDYYCNYKNNIPYPNMIDDQRYFLSTQWDKSKKVFTKWNEWALKHQVDELGCCDYYQLKVKL